MFHAKVTKVASFNDKNETENDEVGFKKFFKQALKNSSAARVAFKNHDYHHAVDIYRKWIQKLKDVRLASDEEEAKQRDLIASMYQNVCICYNKINKPEKTCVMMRELEKLKSIRDNPKALFAKAKANMMLNNYDHARKFFMLTLNLVPDDVGVLEAIKELDRRVQSKALYEAEAVELTRRFKDEAFAIQAEVKEKDKNQDKAHENLEVELKKFQDEFEELAEKFKNDASLMHLSLTIDLSSHNHFKFADETCKRLGIQLKGIQNFSNDSINYFLSKL